MKNHNAVYLVGGPGSGKDFVLRTALKESNATEIPLTKLVTHIREQSDYPEIDGRPLIINGNSDQDQSVELSKAVLESMGYTTAMIFVYTTNESSQKRSIIPESKRQQKYQMSVKNMHTYKDMFEGFFLIDNSNDFVTCNEETQTQMVLWLKELSEAVESFFEAKVAHYAAMGFKVARETKPVGGEPKGGHHVPAGYERVKEGSFYKLRKKKPSPLANQDDTQSDGSGLTEDLDNLFEKEYPTIVDMIAQKKNRRGESQGDKYKGGIAVAGDKATQRTTGTGQAEAVEQKHIITFHHDTGKYRVHKVGCSAAKETRHVTAIEHHGDAQSAVQWAHEDESDKAGKSVKADVAICKCAKPVTEDMANADSTRQEVKVPQTSAKGVRYSKNRPAKGASPPGDYFNSKMGSVPSGGIGLTAYKTEETEPKSVSQLRKK
jgi:hypothetical protein